MQKAVILPEAKAPFVIDTVPIPKPGPGELLVKVQATALNPADWKIQKYAIAIEKYPAVLGWDAAGIVEEIGEGVTGFAKGDRVLAQGFTFDNNHAAFQQYMLTDAEVAAKSPSNISFEEASTVPLGLGTAAVGLYHDVGGLALSPPWEEGGRGKYAGKAAFVIGGASSVGQFAIQLLKLSGFSPIITTASLSNAEYLKELGATHVIDRKLKADDIKVEVAKLTSTPIEIAYDAIGDPDPRSVAYDIVVSGGGIVSVEPIDDAKNIKDKRAEHVFGSVNVHRAFGVGFMPKVTGLLADGSIRPNRVEVQPNGLQGVITGLEKLIAGVSNVKLVVHPQETV